ncbi:hypothetical protein ACJJIC_18420 [Microbulbifer sp. ANSA002]|uniref:hypothetical protein n=1 Tax=unclassified Microbulbifer TaxID=2619833 RepID=UPI00404195AA
MNEKKSNNFVRALLIVLAGFILWVVAYSFLSLEPKGTISSGVITLIVLLVVIVLSESFDNFNVGKLFSISRELKEKEGSIDKLSVENTGLRKELVNIVTSINQNQSSTNIIGLSSDWPKNMGVVKASDDEISNKRNEESEGNNDREKPTRRRVNTHKVEELALSKFLKKRNLSDFDVIKEAKLATQFSGIDAVSNIQPIYDGYINTGDSEIFIEIKMSRTSSLMMKERIYLMLNKIYLYNKVKNANAHLNLLLVDLDGENGDQLRAQRNSDRLKEFFEPSLVNGLLRIIPIELSDGELTEIYTEESATA